MLILGFILRARTGVGVAGIFKSPMALRAEIGRDKFVMSSTLLTLATNIVSTGKFEVLVQLDTVLNSVNEGTILLRLARLEDSSSPCNDSRKAAFRSSVTHAVIESSALYGLVLLGATIMMVMRL
jgi:hypothetical protein